MKKRTIVAVMTACMMLFTLFPSVSLAASDRKDFKSKVPVCAGIDEDYEQMLQQTALEILDSIYLMNIKSKSDYHSVIWSEIQTVYKELMVQVGSMTEDELYYLLVDEEESMGTDFSILEMLGELTWVKNPTKDLSDLKARYKTEITKEYKNYKASEYSEYYWDSIQDGRYVGLETINGAKDFRTAIRGYVTAINAMENAYTKEDMAEYREMINSQIKQYVNLGLDPNRYSSYDWNRLIAIRDNGVKQINAAQMVEEMIQIYNNVGVDYNAITGIEFPMEEYPILTELDEKLERYMNGLDESQYTDAAIEKIEEIYWEASDNIMMAESRAQAQKAYDNAIQKLKAVPTKKQEIAAFKKKTPRIRSVKAVNSTSLKISWKKVSGASGYVVYKATSPKGKYKKIKTVKRGTKYTSGKLKKGKKYYYKVRAYKTIDKKKYYSKLSKKKSGTPRMR